ncbi:DUF4139 domain-containing protein [Streptomyces sp. CA2R106]|uniref:DUF4139 domain-containing protein n=1 Tax=Streptomyces sp. CA2R106 TaxID=3120153 RepID=UPI00300B6AB1
MANGESAPTTGAAERAPDPVRSELTAVVVYARGAVCTRRATVALPVPGGAPGDAPGDPSGHVSGSPSAGGTVQVRVGGLPPTLNAGSLRGSVRSGPPGLRVADVRVDVTATLRRGEQAPGLRLDLEDAEDRLARLRDRRDRLAAEIGEVAGFRAEPPPQRRGDPPRWAPVESILALAGFVDTRLAALHTRLRTTEDELAQAEHDADVLRHRIDEASGALPTDRVEPSAHAVVTLVADGAAPGAEVPDAPGGQGPAWPEQGPAEAELELEYHVPGATWTPSYQLRLDGRSGAATLVLRAGVVQRTGEDWTGVRLGLSTADLLRRTSLPELRSLRIGRSQPAPSGPGWREPPPGLDELFTGYDSARLAEREPAPGGAIPGGGPAGPPPFGPLAGGYGAAAEATTAVGYGAAPELAEHTAGFGAPPAPGAPPLPAPAAALPAPAAPRHAARRSVTAAMADTAAGAGAARPAPAPELLDYARLVLAGPQEHDGRGTLRAADEDTDAVVAEYRGRAEAAAELPLPAHAVDVRRSAGSFDYRFDTAAPVDVAADGRRHTVPVGEIPVRTAFEYVCVPAQDTAVFGTVLVTNTSAHPLLAGPADVMVDGDFVRTAALPTLAPGQRQAVGLGVAESVQVARRAHMRESTAGLRGGTTVLDHTVEVEVANRLPYPALVEVRERIPTSADKDVRIEEHRAEPRWSDPGAPLDGQEETYVPGARVWRVTLEPGRTVTLTGGFEIRLPVGKSVVGGNRRN